MKSDAVEEGRFEMTCESESANQQRVPLVTPPKSLEFIVAKSISSLLVQVLKDPDDIGDTNPNEQSVSLPPRVVSELVPASAPSSASTLSRRSVSLPR